MIVRPNADALMAGELGQWLGAQDQARAEAKAKVASRRFWAIGGAGAVFLFAWIAFGSFTSGLQAAFFVGAAGWAWAEYAKRPVVTAIKGGINGAIARALDMAYSAAVEPGESFERAKRFELVPGYERSSFEDEWVGSVEGHTFRLYEAKLEVERGSGKSRRWETVFGGSLIEVGFARGFHGVTLLEREGRHKTWFGLGGERASLDLGDLRLERCEMVDPRFEDQFTVWSNDPVEARYLVHPEYVERLIAVEQAFAGENIRVLFCGGSLLIALESGNLFESGGLEASDDRRLLEQSIEQFGTLADLAARLNERAR